MLGLLKGTIDAMAKFARGTQIARLSNHRSLFMAEAEPKYLELARAGKLFIASTSAIAGARTPVVDVPTTTANWALYNVHTNSYCLVPLAIAAYVGGGTPATGATLIAGVTPLPLATALAANGASHTIGKLRPNTDVNAFLGIGTTVPTMAAHFHAIANASIAAAAALAHGPAADVAGRFIVPPAHALAVDVIASAGTSAEFSIDILFAKLELDLD